ncbi:phospholipase/carboxylesterase family protein [Xylariaceae sp. FL0662B]|nr:phospholipase/carboxylesterase family protein [Xylariaceae sp. FL0662B]
MDSYLVVQPSAPHTHTVVFLHGRGDNAKEFAASLNHSKDSNNATLYQIFPSFKWVFPQAPIRQLASSPRERWHQWFDIWNISNFAEKEELQAVGLRESVVSIRAVLANAAAELGGRFDRVILAGISQGAATSVHTLLNLDIPNSQGGGAPGRLAAFLGFSCRMPFPGRTLAEARGVLGLQDVPAGDEVVRHTPVLLEHCENDGTVPVQDGRALWDTLRGFGARVEWREYEKGGHWFKSPAGIDDAASFLKEVLELPENTLGSAAQTGTAVDEMDLS